MFIKTKVLFASMSWFFCFSLLSLQSELSFCTWKWQMAQCIMYYCCCSNDYNSWGTSRICISRVEDMYSKIHPPSVVRHSIDPLPKLWWLVTISPIVVKLSQDFWIANSIAIKIQLLLSTSFICNISCLFTITSHILYSTFLMQKVSGKKLFTHRVH